MFVLDRSGKRSTDIDGVEIKDYREVAYIASDNPKYKDTSIYLVPDNYMHDLKGIDEKKNLIGQAKGGRKGRRIKKNMEKDVEAVLDMSDDEMDEYLKFIERGDEIKHVAKKVNKLYQDSIKAKSRSLVLDDMDWPNKEGVIQHGELVPMPITNFTNEKLEKVLKGETTIYIQRQGTKEGDFNKVILLGDRTDELKEKGYNGLPPDLIFFKHEERYIPLTDYKGESNPWHPYEPNGEELVEITYIYGPNRSGKTYYAAKYSALWSDMFKDWPIYLFSRRSTDRVLDELPNLSRVLIDESILTNPLTMTDFEHSLVIFDDIDTIPDKSLCKAVQKLRDDIMETGRQKMIYVINTSHLGMNWGPTKTVLNEANSYTLFPRKGNYGQNFKILELKLGMNKDIIRSILDRPNGIAHNGKWGWVTIYKDSPQYLISENGVYLL